MKLTDVIKTGFVKKMQFVIFDKAQKNIDGGVYRMFDENDKIIYVGKSSNLHVRLMNHLAHRTHTDYFMDEVKYIDWYMEPNPIYETLLEGILIAYHKPKYNDEVKDFVKKSHKDL